MGFEGIVLSDWYLITDHVLSGEALSARVWGVEHYSELERAQGVLDASCDQFGGEVRPELLVQLVEEGKVSMESKSNDQVDNGPGGYASIERTLTRQQDWTTQPVSYSARNSSSVFSKTLSSIPRQQSV